MTVEQDTASVSKMLRQRQKEMLVQKEEHMKQISQHSDELKKMFAKAPKKPRRSIKELDDEINALEFRRTTTSLVLAEEKDILRQIDFLKRSKALCEESRKHEQAIQEKKAEIDALRDSLSLILASIDELAPVLEKVELADRLQCATTELITVNLDCPKEKARHVIGRNGCNVKQIMERTSVAIDVDSDTGKIKITGSQSAVDDATKEIRRITDAVEEDVQVSPALVEYLTTRRLNTFAEFREQHPDVFVDVSRNTTNIRLDGLVEDVANAKDALLNMDIKQESRSLTSAESSVVVGKNGVTINKLVDDHKVMIDVDSRNARVVGPSPNVDAAMSSIDEVLELNKDVTERVPIDAIVRSVLLNNGGERIKKLQAVVNEKVNEGDGAVFLQVDKTARKDSSVLIKARLPALAVACEVMEEALKEIRDSVVTIHIDPCIAPRLIGKGGANIKKMKSQGDGVLVEIDDAGKIELYGAKEDVDVVAQAIQTVVDENKMERLDLDVDASSIKPMYRALIRDKNKEINSIIPGCDLDEGKSQIVLRGSVEQIKTVSEMIEDFMAHNYIEDIKYSVEDESALLMGGADCVLNKMAQELDVDLSVVRSNHVIVARGEKEKVLVAKKRLNQFLHGGDGHTVSKLLISEQAVGSVVGRGGSRRMELEDKHEGVKIFIERANGNGVITIRGPEQPAHDCRTDILKIVSGVRVQESLPITPQQHAELSKPEMVRRLMGGIPVFTTVTEKEITVRGIFTDVRDALALLKAHVTGVYETRVELDSSQYNKVSAACRDPSHFNRMKESSSAQIELDSASSSIVIRGKRGNVKKAKNLVMGFLDFLLPGNWEHIKMPKVFQSSVASAASLADVAANSGASVVLDRDLNAVQVQSSDPDKVKEATALIKAKMVEAEKLVFLLQIDQSEAWITPSIIGKNGVKINAMSKESGCRIDVSKQELTVTIVGEDEESVAKAKAALAAVMDKARRECVFVQLPSNAVPAFIGKSGAHIRGFAEKHGVEVERVRKDPSKVRITGQEDSVSAAKSALLEWIKVWEENNAEVSIPVDKSMFPVVLGKDGSVINAIQKDSGTRIDLDRASSTVTIRGSSLEKRNEAVEKIKEIIAEAQAAETERDEKKKERDAEEKAERTKAAVGEKKKPSAAGSQPIEDLESRKDRAVEFAARPVGLTKGGGVASKQQNKQPIKDDSSLVGTATGRNLFGLLVSDSSLDTTDDNKEAVIRPSLAASEDQESPSESSADDAGPVYVRSASGFAVRV